MLTSQNYHADTTHVSKSGLDLINHSPLHYWHKYLNPNREPEEEKPALIFGRLAHTLMFEPEKFERDFVESPKFDRRTKEGKAGHEAFSLSVNGRTPVLADAIIEAQMLVDAAKLHPNVDALLAMPGQAETVFVWQDAETGVMCKCRPDWVTEDGWILDLKSTTDATPEAFGRSAFNYRYHVQASYYIDGYYAATGNTPKGFVFIAVEKEQPNYVAVYYATDEQIELGRIAYKKDLQVYAECKRTGIWNAPAPAKPLQLPAYAFKQEN